MTRDTADSGRIRAAELVVAVALATAIVTSVGVAGVAATTSDTSGATGQAQLTNDSSGTAIAVVLPEAAEGLAGYELTLAVESGSVTGASYPDAFQPTTEPAIDGEGEAVTLEAADVSDRITAGATDVRLATVTVEGADGAPTVTIRDASIDADGGGRIDVNAVRATAAGGSDDGQSLRSSDGGPAQGQPGDGNGTVETEAATTGGNGAGFGVAVGGLAVGVIALLARRE